MPELLFYFFLGSLISFNLSCVWEISLFRVNLFNFIYRVFGIKRENFSHEDWLVDAALNWGFLGEMLSCTLCYGTWLSLLVSGIMWYCFPLPIWFPVVCALSWPAINYFFISKLTKPNEG